MWRCRNKLVNHIAPAFTVLFCSHHACAAHTTHNIPEERFPARRTRPTCPSARLTCSFFVGLCWTSLRPDFDGRRLYVSPSARLTCSFFVGLCWTSLRPDFGGHRHRVSPSDRPACSPPTSSHTRDTQHITLHVILALLTHCFCCTITCITQKQRTRTCICWLAAYLRVGVGQGW